MGAARWSLDNKRKPEGQLHRVEHFLAAGSGDGAAAGSGRIRSLWHSDENARDAAGANEYTGGLSACSVRVPIAMDPKKAILAAGDLASTNTRSLEVWWDAAEKRLDFVLVAAGDRDLDAFKRTFLNMYPNAGFVSLESAVPIWFEPSLPCQIFDVGTQHGHYSAVFDKGRAHHLMTRVASMIQLSKNAWIQVVFRRYDFGDFLRKHVDELDSKVKEIKQGNYLSASDQILYSDKKPHDHPELGRDLTRNHRILRAHATQKRQAAQVMMSIRGLVIGEDDIDLDFDEIQSMPVENVASVYEHVGKFRYKFQNFYNSDKPKRVQVRITGSKKRCSRIDLFRLRLLPDPKKLTNAALNRYLGKDLLGRYHTRNPLPFLILTLDEMALFAHLPDSSAIPNLDATRGIMMPSKPSTKSGVPLGFFNAGHGGSDRDVIWGQIVHSKDADAAVIALMDLATHVYVLGGSGSGKTTLIRALAKHLEVCNRNRISRNAFIYLDPKGDDSHKFVRQCDADAVSGGRVHFLDPQQTKFSINPLELPAHSPWEREETVSRYVGYFMKTIEEWYQQSTSYVQMERIFRALLFYIYVKHDAPTFLDIYHIILKLQNGGPQAIPEIIRTYGAPEPAMRQALDSIATLKGDAFTPLLNRVEQFATDPVLRRMFCVRKGTVDFAEIIQPGHQTIVRISPLNMPHYVQPLAMQTFILKLWFTIQERANRVPDESERTQVVLALDEFQIVKDMQALQLMLEQARSLGLGLVLSHQTAEQISDKQLGLITGNSGTQLVGKVNGKDASRIAQIWDPQFQKELQQRLSSQEYFHWTMREKAPPGQEQPPPVQFWLAKPPDMIVTDAEYEGFVREQLAKYGSGTVGLNAMAQAASEKSRWLENIQVELPTRMEWRIMCLLHQNAEMQQTELADQLRVQNRDEVAAALRGMVERGLVERTGMVRTAPYALSKKAEQAYFGFDYAEVGTASDVAEVSQKAVDAYLERGLFVTVAAQRIRKGTDRTDLVAYDYERKIPISVEIESASEVQSHPEHVRYNMTKWPKLGFAECHVWSKSPKIRGILEQLDGEEKERVSVMVISS